jgi:nitrogen regulatory protein P-II 1
MTVIRKSKFDEVKEALHKIEVNFFTYWDVTGWVKKGGHVYREYHLQHHRHSTKIYFHCRLIFFGKTIDTILEAASTGMVGWKNICF